MHKPIDCTGWTFLHYLAIKDNLIVIALMAILKSYRFSCKLYIYIYNVIINSSGNIIYGLLHYYIYIYIYIYKLHENLYDFKMAIKAITIKLSFIAKRCKKVQPVQSIGSCTWQLYELHLITISLAVTKTRHHPISKY